MTSPTDLDSRMLSRLLAINWHGDQLRTRSRVALFREYLRRATLWARALDCTSEWPFFDVAWHVDPTLRARPPLVEALDRRLSEIPLWSAVRDTCVWSLQWAAVQAHSRGSSPALDDPFEPLVRMYERGGGFTSEHGFIQVDFASLRLGAWRDHDQPEPVVRLDDATLDALDAGH